jgi:heat-inducible transcriptional repressor
VISIQDTVALLIVLLQDGAVLQEMFTLPDLRTQDELSALADRLNQRLRGMAAWQIDGQADLLSPPDATVAGAVSHLLQRAQERNMQVYHTGLADMIQQPEFLQPRAGEPAAVTLERLRRMLEFLQHGFAVERLLATLPRAFDVQVVIGGEAQTQELHDYSFVLGRYGRGAEGSGYLGVVGPTRMEYPRAVALVRYMAGLMSDLMHLH